MRHKPFESNDEDERGVGVGAVLVFEVVVVGEDG
jgi:hypothetical protein